MSLFKIDPCLSLGDFGTLLQDVRTHLYKESKTLLLKTMIERGVMLWDHACLTRKGLLAHSTCNPLQHAGSEEVLNDLWRHVRKAVAAYPPEPPLSSEDVNVKTVLRILKCPQDTTSPLPGGTHLLMVDVAHPILLHAVEYFLLARGMQKIDLPLTSLRLPVDAYLCDMRLVEEDHCALFSEYPLPQFWQDDAPSPQARLHYWMPEYSSSLFRVHQERSPSPAPFEDSKAWWASLSREERERLSDPLKKTLNVALPSMLFKEGGWTEALRLFEADLLDETLQASCSPQSSLRCPLPRPRA